MKVLIAGLPRSPHAIRHANLLVDAGIEVGFVPVLPQSSAPDLDARVTIFPHPGTPPILRFGPRGALDRGSGAMRHAIARVRLAAWRTAAQPLAVGARMPVRGDADDGLRPYTDRPIDTGLRDIITAVGVQADITSAWLAHTIDAWRPDIVASTGLEQGGYVTLAARSRCSEPFPRWLPISLGLDLALSVRFPHHRRWIAAVLKAADALFLECERDVPVARELGFAGDLVEVQPIGGGWDVDAIGALRLPGPTSARTTIAVKGYGGWVGRGFVALEGMRRAADALLAAEMDVALFAAHRDVAFAAELLAVDTGLRIEVWPRLSYSDLLAAMGRCRAIVGMSAADAIATTALEAILAGAVPIQSDTSCLGEWIACGRGGLLVPADDPEPLAAAIRRVAEDAGFVDAAIAENDRVALPRLRSERVNPEIVALYRRLAEM